MKVKSKKYIDFNDKVYDIKVQDNHNYMITENDIIVHNSGKGFVLSQIIDFQGKVFDVDEMKKQIQDAGSYDVNAKDKLSKQYLKKVEKAKDFKQKSINIIKKMKHDDPKSFNDLPDDGIEPNQLNLKTPSHVALLHAYVDEFNLDKKRKDAFFGAIDPKSDHKPNVIFDVTLKRFGKLKEVYDYAMMAGYDIKNIHIVWILNDLEVAKRQNKSRSRQVPEDILVGTHEGASKTMAEIISQSSDVRKYADGDIWIMFNKVTRTQEDDPNLDRAEDDNFVKVGKSRYNIEFNDKEKVQKNMLKKGGGKSFEVKRYTAVKIKDRGSAVYSPKQIEDQLKDVFKKVLNYVPAGSFNLG